MRAPDGRTFLYRAAIAAVVLCVAGVPAGAQENPQIKLKEVEKALERGRSRTATLEKEAAQLEAELQSLQKTMVESAGRAQRQEEIVSDLEGRLDAYRAEERQKVTRLNQRRATTDAVLAALQRIARVPPEALIAMPSSVVDTARTSIVLSAVVPELELEAAALRDDLVALRNLRTEISTRVSSLSAARTTLDRERVALDRLIDRKSRLHSKTLSDTDQERKQLASLSSNAADLRALVDRLEEESRRLPVVLAPPSGRTLSFSAGRGTMPFPAKGRILRRYGEPEETGVTNRGLVIETRPAAQVVAPFDGRIVFAGPFRRYGQLLIIAHGEGYHTLLAGIASIDGTVGQWLLAGEPIGRMGPATGQKPELYIELRRNGEPINPLPWLVSETKVNG